MMDLFDDLPLPKNETTTTATTNNNNHDKISTNKRELESDEKEDNQTAKNDASTNESSKKLCTNVEIPVEARGFFAERKGERDSMQDRHTIVDDFAKCLKKPSSEIKNMSYYGVFDGHAGHRAADYCAKNLHVILADRLSKAIENNYTLEVIEKEIKRYLTESFKQCDEEFLKLAASNKPSWKDGTTATMILIINRTLYSANIGDSKAIIYGVKDEKDQIVELTCEHTALVYEERMRVQKTGASLKDGRVLGVLEVTRSIGDGQFKAYGVTCVPDVRKCLLNSSYKYVMIACDGLWKSFGNEEAIEFIKSTMKQKEDDNSVFELCCNKIANEAVKKLTADNVTVLIVSIKCD